MIKKITRTRKSKNKNRFHKKRPLMNGLTKNKNTNRKLKISNFKLRISKRKMRSKKARIEWIGLQSKF